MARPVDAGTAGPAGPAVWRRLTHWLGRLSVSRKLMLIYLLDLTAVIYVSGILIHEKFLSIDFTRKEIVGAQYSGAVRDLLLIPFLKPAGEGARQASSSEALARLETLRWQHDPALGTAELSPAFVRDWKQLRDQAPGPGRDSALKANLRQARELLTTVGNQSNLILDPDLDSYYAMSLVVLRFPELLEVLHDTALLLSGRGERAVVHGERRTELLILAGRIDAVVLGIRSDYVQAFAAGQPALRQALTPSEQALTLRLGELLAAVQRLSEARVDEGHIQAYRRAYAESLQVLASSWALTGQSLSGLLQARVDSLFSRMWLHLGTALLLLGCILSLVYVVARQISRPLKQLARVADEVRRTGDHSRRAAWHSRDEIGQLVGAFNGMLAQLDEERLVQQELAASARAAQTQQQMVEATPIAMVVTSIPDHDVLYANTPAQPWLGDRLVDPWRTGLEPGVRARFFQRLADRGAVDEFEVRWLGGASPSWAVLSARRMSFQGRDSVLTTFTPINVLKVMEQRLELWSKVFEASSESIIIMDAQQRILSVNRAFCRSTTYDYYEVIGEQLGMLLDPQSPNPLPEQLNQALEDRDSWQGEVLVRKRSGDCYPAWLMISAVRDQARQGDVSQYIGISVDITDRKRTEARVQFLAEHDVLTELPNRSLCVARLRQAMEAARASQRRAAVLFIDLDRFKIINDSLGHHIGDGLLRSVASRLSQAVRGGDTVSRLGGDEFVIVMADINDGDEVRAAVERRLIPLIRQPHLVEGQKLQVSCSVGVAIYPDDSHDLDELMRQADAAMYEAKSSGRDMARFFTPEIDQHARERQVLEQHLRLALEREELTLHYQPRVDADSQQLVGVEALLRWQHPELGAVSPARFIPVAEETGLIHAIGLWVLRQACLQQARWRQQGLPPLVLSVNLSAAQLTEPGLVGQLQVCLLDSGIDPASLELEITESHLMDNASASEQLLHGFKALGVQVSIDDFGTGYSSLAYLKRFPIDKLKIDQSFVRDLLTDPTDLSIVRAIIALGHNLGLGVVAEGVESAEVGVQLKLMGCDELQGYHYARPMPAAQLPEWLHHRPSAAERRRLRASAR